MGSTQPTSPQRLDVANRVGQQTGSNTTTNVGRTERLFSAIGGGMLTTYGITRRDWPGVGLALLGGGLILRGVTGRSALYKALRQNTADPHISTNITALPDGKGLRIRRSQTIQGTPDELYTFWRDLELAPAYMPGIETVILTGQRTARWIATKNAQSWNSEILEDQPGKLIAWHVYGHSTTANAGKVIFQPATEGHGTVVTLELDFFEPDLFTKLAGHVKATANEYEVIETLRRFKEVMEAGEIPTIKGQPTGKGRK